MKLLAVSAIFLVIYANCNGVVLAKSGKMPVQPIKLYYLPPSPPCRAVMMTARVLGIELELIVTNIMNGDQLTPEFLKMNPQHTIPTMDDSGFILWESRAIMRYLSNMYGRDDSLYPKNPRLRAVVDQRLDFDIGLLFSRYLDLYKPLLQGGTLDDQKASKLNEALGFLDSMLDGRAFVAGENMTLADITVVVTLTNLNAFHYDFKPYPNAVDWFDRTKKYLEPYGYMEIDDAGAQILASLLPADRN